MAAEVLKDFLARLGFEVDEAGAAEFDSALASGTTKVLAFGAAIQTLAVGAYAAIYGIASRKSDMLMLSDAIGQPVEKLEELAFVAEQTGSSADRLYSSLESVTEAVAGAAIGQGGLETFHRLGVSIRDRNGELRDSVDVLMEVGEKVKDMDRAKATMFLGQLGIDRSLIKMLTSDVSGLRTAYRDMYDAVGVDAQQAAEDSRAFVGEVKALYTMVKMVGDGIAAIFVGQMGHDVAAFRKMIQDNVGKIIPVLKTIIDVILRIGKAFFALTARLMSWVGMIVDWFGRLDSATQKLILGVVGFTAAWKWLNLSFLATPIGAVIAGLVGLLALIDDFMTWRDGGNSLIDWGPWADDIGEVIDALSGLMDILKPLWGMIKGPLFEAIGSIAKTVLANLAAIMSALVAFVTAIVRLFQGDLSGAVDAVGDAFGHLWDIITNLVSSITSVLGSLKDVVGGVISWAVEAFGGAPEIGGGQSSSPAPVLGPSPAMAVAAGGSGRGDTVISTNTEIKVDGSGSPEATARAVGGAQNRVNADLLRHAKGAVR